MRQTEAGSDMSVFGAVQERTYKLIETGEYVFTLNDIEYEPNGAFGEALIWKWMLAPKEDPTAYICKANGDEFVLYQYTDVDLNIGSKQHAWAQLLYGKPLESGATPPDENELIGRRMVALLTHYTPKKGKNAGKPKEAIVDGSAKAFRGVQPNRPIQYAPAAEPAAPANDGRAALIEKVERLIGKAVKLETRMHADYVKLDLNDADDLQLQMLANSIQDEITKALDA